MFSSFLQYVLCIHLHFHRPSDLKGDYIILSWRYISSAWNKVCGSTVHSYCIVATSRKTSHQHSFHHDSKKVILWNLLIWRSLMTFPSFNPMFWVTQTTELIPVTLVLNPMDYFLWPRQNAAATWRRSPYWSEVYEPCSTNGRTTTHLILLFSLLCLVFSPAKPATGILYKLSGKKILLRTTFSQHEKEPNHWCIFAQSSDRLKAQCSSGVKM